MRNWLGYLVFYWEVWNTWAWRVSLFQDLQWLELNWSSTRCLCWQWVMGRKPEERVCPSRSLGAALKLKPYHRSLLMLHHSSHRNICAHSCTATVAPLGNYQTQSDPGHCLWPQSWPKIAFPQSGSLLVLLPACLLPLAHLRITWPSLVSGTSNMILALPTSPLLVRTILQKASDFNPLLKAKSTTMHIF